MVEVGGSLLPSSCYIYPDLTYWLSARALGPDSLGPNSVQPLNAHVTLHFTLPGLSFPICKMVLEGWLTAHNSQDLCGRRRTQHSAWH